MYRLPTILGKAIEDATRTLNEQYEEEKVIDLVQCVERMVSLKTDLSSNANLRYIVDGQCSAPLPCCHPIQSSTFITDGEADYALWNKQLARYFSGMNTWKSRFDSILT